MQKKEARAARSGRRPLRLLSNVHDNRGDDGGSSNNGGKWSSKPRSGKKLFSSSVRKIEGKVGADETGDDGILDRLLLVQSDLTNITCQIDEIIVQAFKLDEMSELGKKEVGRFATYLSEMLSSLKQWAPRLQNALLDSSRESEKPVAPSSSLGTDSGTGDLVGDDDNNESISVSSPDQIELGSLISPSPLVSWRANCTVGRGRQIFLLTPLPITEAPSFKLQESSKSALENMASATDFVPSLQASWEKSDGDMPKDGEERLTSNQPSGKQGFDSPITLRTKDYSVLMMTPCFKVSPPRSCALLEPISESVQWKNCNARKSTPFPVGLSSDLGESSESSCSKASDGLATKYPELLGIRRAQNLGVGKKERESSPDWFFSPPKSCILMEPPRGNHEEEADILLTNVICIQDSNQRTQKQEPSARSTGGIESTPVLKDPQSTFARGKRPGETTLKRELWTKFEAASCGFRLNGCGGLDLEEKGFLDRLDEVSLEE
ncbi:hypothetical protein SAY86_014558 [Trapa natans]|uniref:Uncharacterized protein n=1 Tax=Trapa natans TaxID=22666 RepID=A0AAN7KND9_TRANT|nr:hypothetical protein SAY86_014558 [Trapa natans]